MSTMAPSRPQKPVIASRQPPTTARRQSSKPTVARDPVEHGVAVQGEATVQDVPTGDLAAIARATVDGTTAGQGGATVNPPAVARTTVDGATVEQGGVAPRVYTISLGSNVRAAYHLAWARRRLREVFPGIRFSPEERTEPLLLHHRADPFANQVAQFASVSPPEAVRALLKAMEHEAGRRPDDRRREIVRLDLDLLTCDATVFKPDDLRRDFIARGIDGLRGVRCSATGV